MDQSQPRPHPTLHRARHGADGSIDSFLGFWLMLMAESRQGGMRLPNRMRRTIQDFFAGADVRAALDDAGRQAVHDELQEAAAVYWATCKTDPHYSSKMFGMGRLDPREIERKAANELVKTLRAMLASDGLQGPAEPLASLLIDGFIATFGSGASSTVREAAAGTSAEHLLPNG